jgi:ribosome-binding factor A
MAKIRTGRVGEQIKKELSQILQNEFKDPRIGFMTITGVDVTNDFSEAKVYLSVLGSDQQREDAFKALERGTGFLRSELSKRVRLRITPKLIFKFDSSIDYGTRIQELLGKINEGKADE